MRRLSREASFRDHRDVVAVGEDDEAEHEEQYEPPKKRLTRMSVQQTDLASCLICQKGKKKIAGNKYKEEKLSRVEMASGIATLVQAARRLNDKRVLLTIEDGNIDFYAAAS